MHNEPESASSPACMLADSNILFVHSGFPILQSQSLETTINANIEFFFEMNQLIFILDNKNIHLILMMCCIEQQYDNFISFK